MSSSATNMASQRGALSPRDYTPAGPRISLEQSTPDASQYQNAGQLPGSLQPGPPGRPGPITANTAPNIASAAQSLSQDQYSTPSRSSALGLSHNYTRSSPAAGFDGQQYTPFAPTTPSSNDQSQFASPTNQKYTPQNSQRAVSNTPLGLADIRPRADSNLQEALPGANPYSYDGANAVPTNSNYLAPWAIYAFDWCKWPAQNNDAGKVALGSYLEDGHNFVSSNVPTSVPLLTLCTDPNPRLTHYTHSKRIIHSRCSKIWAGIYEDSGSYSLLPCYTSLMGTSILSKAVYRSTRNIRGPS